jgi:hypothetical protein
LVGGGVCRGALALDHVAFVSCEPSEGVESVVVWLEARVAGFQLQYSAAWGVILTGARRSLRVSMRWSVDLSILSGLAYLLWRKLEFRAVNGSWLVVGARWRAVGRENAAATPEKPPRASDQLYIFHICRTCHNYYRYLNGVRSPQCRPSRAGPPGAGNRLSPPPSAEPRPSTSTPSRAGKPTSPAPRPLVPPTCAPYAHVRPPVLTLTTR